MSLFDSPRQNYFYILMLFMVTTFGCTSKDYYLLVGTYTASGSNGIYVYKFNAQNGKTTLVSSTDSVINPSFLVVRGNFVYAVNETNGDNPGSVSAFAFDKKKGTLQFLNKQPTGGDDPCHLSITNDGKWVAVANYSGGSVTLFPVNEDGSLQPFSQLIQHLGSSVNKERQQKPHVHETVFSSDNNYLFTPDLGLDKIMIYRFNPEDKKPLSSANPAFIATHPGSGPRHFVLSPDERFGYVIQELNGMVTVYSHGNGKFTEVQNIPTYPEGYKGVLDGAEIVISADGNFLYTSQRGNQNSVTIFSIDKKSGLLSNIGTQSTLGKGPRNFIIGPTGNYLLAANQGSNNIVILKRNKNTGQLTETGLEIKVPMPVCLQMVSAD